MLHGPKCPDLTRASIQAINRWTTTCAVLHPYMLQHLRQARNHRAQYEPSEGELGQGDKCRMRVGDSDRNRGVSSADSQQVL